ncbi:MAG TPA: HesA/MoeB/ThiF family protein [Candidatus Bathyarchaeota archaeon]|nr:HesA/MoeB/ThiF family protein [Candidatus Bathyarchaeota archaeon]
MGSPGLSREELERYDRQIRIPEIGLEGQLKLKEARAVVIGLGGLGCPIAMYLASAGIGHLRLIDKGRVEEGNLNRQVLYREQDVGRHKAILAAERIRELNPHVEVEPVVEEVSEDNVEGLLEGADVALDGLDNWHTRLIVNRACVKLGIPFIHAGVKGFYGQVMTILPGKGPCLRCLLRATPPEEPVVPIVGATAAVLASIQALEAIKLITGLGEPLVGRLLVFDGLKMRFEELLVSRRPDCPVCGGLS